jgi:hypothetical protein
MLPQSSSPSNFDTIIINFLYFCAVVVSEVVITTMEASSSNSTAGTHVSALANVVDAPAATKHQLPNISHMGNIELSRLPVRQCRRLVKDHGIQGHPRLPRLRLLQ